MVEQLALQITYTVSACNFKKPPEEWITIMITTLVEARNVLSSVMMSDWLDNPDEGIEGEKPSQIIDRVGCRPVIERIATVLGVEPDTPIGELGNQTPLELYQQLDGEDMLLEVLMMRLSHLLSRSWFQRSMDVFQGLTPNDVLESPGGKAAVIRQIETLALEQLRRPLYEPEMEKSHAAGGGDKSDDR